MRICKTCGQERQDSDFREGHPNSDCRVCRTEQAIKYYWSHPDFRERQLAQHRIRNHEYNQKPEVRAARNLRKKLYREERGRDERLKRQQQQLQREIGKAENREKSKLLREEKKRRSEETYPERHRRDFARYYREHPEKILRRIAIKELRKILGPRYRCPEDMVRAQMATILLKRKINKKPGGELQWPTLNSLSMKSRECSQSRCAP